VVSGVRRMNTRRNNARRARLVPGWVNASSGGYTIAVCNKPTRSTQPCIPPGLLTSFGWGEGGNVTTAGWQVKLCDPMWHESSSSGVATLRTAIHLLLTYLLANLVGHARQRHEVGWLQNCSAPVHTLAWAQRTHVQFSSVRVP